MPTSELSDALNPYASQSRSRNTPPSYPVSYQPQPQAVAPAVQQQQYYAPHRSELELAISEPLPSQSLPPAMPPSIVAMRNRTSTEGVNAVQELIRLISTTRDAHESERQRRIAWEQEYQAKLIQKEEDTNRQIAEMRQTIVSLQTELDRVSRSSIPPVVSPAQASGLFTPHSHYNATPPLPENIQTILPASPIPQSSAYSQPMFLQGSSRNPLPENADISHYSRLNRIPQDPPPMSEDEQPTQHMSAYDPPPLSMTPSPSPQLAAALPSPHRKTTVRPANSKKRSISAVSSDDEDHGAVSSSSSSSGVRPIKRVSHHDKRCLTIHHAMRLHILRFMRLPNDKELPDSHKEAITIGEDDPVRFVWDKTTRQSLHNARMKSRITEDIRDKRRLYKHVPSKEFGKKIVDAAFEQCFTTLRQKFKAQRDLVAAENFRLREEFKARKSRHLNRKKAKLNNRAEARMNIKSFEHVTFDGALQIECMSSEESDIETDSVSSRQSGLLRTRGYAWRSNRLIRFYGTLDDEDRLDKSEKPKRGNGRKGRCVGPPKEGNHLPPKGVASWMISKRWYRSAIIAYPDLPNMLKKVVDDPEGFDWELFHDLGSETEDEQPVQEPTGLQETPTFDPHHNALSISHYNTSTSSLNYAFV